MPPAGPTVPPAMNQQRDDAALGALFGQQQPPPPLPPPSQLAPQSSPAALKPPVFPPVTVVQPQPSSLLPPQPPPRTQQRDDAALGALFAQPVPGSLLPPPQPKPPGFPTMPSTQPQPSPPVPLPSQTQQRDDATLGALVGQSSPKLPPQPLPPPATHLQQTQQTLLPQQLQQQLQQPQDSLSLQQQQLQQQIDAQQRQLSLQQAEMNRLQQQQKQQLEQVPNLPVHQLGSQAPQATLSQRDDVALDALFGKSPQGASSQQYDDAKLRAIFGQTPQGGMTARRDDAALGALFAQTPKSGRQNGYPRRQASIERLDDEALAGMFDYGHSLDLKRSDARLMTMAHSEGTPVRVQRANTHNGILGSAATPLRTRQPGTAGSRRVTVTVKRRDELKRISNNLNSTDLTLQRDLVIGGQDGSGKTVLARGLRLLRLGSLKGCELVRAALERLEPWATLIFEPPGVSGTIASAEAAAAIANAAAAKPSELAAASQEASHRSVQCYDWRCPACNGCYPVQVPEESTATSLLQQLFPKGTCITEPPSRDLWLDAELDVPGKNLDASNKKMPQDERGHLLKAFVAPRASFPCSICRRGMDLGTAMRGCTECFFFACAACFLRAVDNGGSFAMKPLPSSVEKNHERARRAGEQRLALLQRFSAKHFNLAPALDYGTIRCPRTDMPEVARYVKRGDDGTLFPLADPYDYYARATILHSMAHICSSSNQGGQVLNEVLLQCVSQPLYETIKMIKTTTQKSEIDGRNLIAALEAEQTAVHRRQQTEWQARERVALLLKASEASLLQAMALGLLREAREAMLAALHGGDSGPNRLAQQQFGYAKAHNPHADWSADLRSRDDKAAADPRLWYLMGLILADLGAFEEARQIFRRVLARLPMSCFGHIVHFNLACLQANQPGDAAKAGALRELKEFRRHCRSLQGLRVGGIPSLSCELCGAPQ